MEYTGKVGARGDVIIPKKFRDQIGIKPGTKVMLTKGKDAIYLEKLTD